MAPAKPENLSLSFSFDRTKKWVGSEVLRNGEHRIEGHGSYTKKDDCLAVQFKNAETQEKKEFVVECMILHLKKMGVTQATPTGSDELVAIAKQMMARHGINVKGQTNHDTLTIDSAPRPR